MGAGTSPTTIGATWTVTTPFAGGSGFNAATGTWTVPAAGTYAIHVALSFDTNSPTTSTADPGPELQLRRTSPSAATLLSQPFPVFDTNLAGLVGRVILGVGEVVLAGDLVLAAADQLTLVYNPRSEANTAIDLGGPSGTTNPIVWSVHRIA